MRQTPASPANLRAHVALKPGKRRTPKAESVTGFPANSLESELALIGQSVPAEAWANVPADYFANLDRYLHGEPNNTNK